MRVFKQGLLAAMLAVALSHGQPAASQGYQQFIDPRENAFSLQVPSDWQVQGGMVRYGSDPKIVVQMRAPDGAFIEIGDPSIRSYMTPGPYVPPVGQPWNLGQGVTVLVYPYMDGPTYAEKWGGSVVQRLCHGGVRTLHVDPAPNLTGTALSRLGNPANSGVAIFTCGDQAAFVYATTFLRTSSGPFGTLGSWNDEEFGLAIAPPNQLRGAVATLGRVLMSLRINPQWFMRQMQLSGQGIEAARQMTNTLMQQQERESVNTEGSALNSFDRMLRGYFESPGGREIPGQGGYGWNCGGRTVTTQSYLPPNPSCTQIR